MPAVSKKQRRTAGMAAAIQKGEMAPQPGMPATEMAASMKPADVREFASTPEKRLPMKKKKSLPVKMVDQPVKTMPFPKR